MLASYQQVVRTDDYTPQLREMLARLGREYGYSEEDAFLVLKDILAQIWNARESASGQ